mgnify:CR=1 FL=1
MRLRARATWPVVLVALAGPALAHATKWLAPDDARANPVPAGPESRRSGAALTRSTASSRHGAMGKGDGPMPSLGHDAPHDLTNPGAAGAHTDGEILWKMTQGRKEDGHSRDARNAERTSRRRRTAEESRHFSAP